LQINLTTWLLFAGTALVWGASVLLLGDRSARPRLTWRTIPLSVFGFVWVGFGGQFILRFLSLAYDPDLFRATRFPPWLLSAEVLSRTWLALGIFWVLFCIGYGAVFILMPKAPRTTIIQFEHLVSLRKVRILDGICLVTLLAIFLSNMKMFPRALVTPMGLVGSLFIIPLAIAWFLYFQRQPIGFRRFIYIVPGIIKYILSPYREHLLVVVLAMVLPAIKLRRTLSIYKVLIGIFAFLLISTVVNDIYRPIKWEEKSRLAQERLEDQWETWKEDPSTSPWVRLITRFHAFDSTAITINAIPSFFSFSKRNVFTELLVRAIMPRAIFDTKPDKDRGREFSSTIWSLTERGLPMKRPATMIAPSMVGDLYSANGLPMVFLGGLIFGLLAALLERWVSTSGQASSCINIAYFGVVFAWALESDFAHAVATIIQHFVVLVLVFFLLTKIEQAKVLPKRHQSVKKAAK
jgi:hypothetical protein